MTVRYRNLAALQPVSQEFDVGTVQGFFWTSARPSKRRALTDSEESASRSQSTSTASGGTTDMVIAHRGDLVNSIFGSLIAAADAALFRNEFLKMGLLTVAKSSSSQAPVPEAEWPLACRYAQTQVEHASTSSESPPEDLYKWTWTLDPNASAALFLNVVTISAYAAAVRLGKSGSHPCPSLRFISLPNPNCAVPLPNDSSTQDCRPDVLAFEASAFHSAPAEDDPSRLRFWLLPHSPFEYIKTKLPRVWEFTAPEPQHKPAIAAFELWFEEQASKSYLDTARFCWPEVQLAVEATFGNRDLRSAIQQELVYMRTSR